MAQLKNFNTALYIMRIKSEGKMSPKDELAMLKANVKNPAQSDEAKEKMKARIKELEVTRIYQALEAESEAGA